MDSGLYIVATPIGNLGDISARAVEILQSAGLIAAEDTRHSQRLLQHFGIATPVTAYHDYSDARTSERLIQRLRSGENVALISDAGTPLISDPGYRLVRQVQDEGFAVYPVPGPCAAIAALSVSGLPTDRFLFEGFLPAKAMARSKRLQALAGESASMVFYEAPHRLHHTLCAMVESFGAGREAFLAREITKTFETLRRAELGQLVDFVASDPNQQRGEVVLVVAGQHKEEVELDAGTAALLCRLAEELPAKRAAAVVADLTGIRKKALYDFLLAQKEG